MSPTQRTLKHLRAAGYNAWIVEHWNAFARKRQDLYGFIDVLGIRKGETLAVQCTSASNVSSRVKKIAEHENMASVRDAGWRIEVHGWTKGKRGAPRIVDVS